MNLDKAESVIKFGIEIRQTADSYEEALEMVGCLVSLFLPSGSELHERRATYETVLSRAETFYEAITETMGNPVAYAQAERLLQEFGKQRDAKPATDETTEPPEIRECDPRMN